MELWDDLRHKDLEMCVCEKVRREVKERVVCVLIDCTRGADNFKVIKTEKAVPISPANTANMNIFSISRKQSLCHTRVILNGYS